MKHIKLFEKKIKEKLRFKINDIVKIYKNEYKQDVNYDSKIYQIIDIQRKNVNLPFPTKYICQLKLIYNPEKVTVNDFWIRAYQLELAPEEEVSANKYNL